MNQQDEVIYQTNESDRSWLYSLLTADETVLWSGKPLLKKVFHKQDRVMIPVCLVWCVLAVLWEIAAIGTGNLMIMVWGVPFLIIGGYVLVGRYFAAYRQKKKTNYALTDKRVIRMIGDTTEFLTWKQVPSLRKTVYRDGAGTIYFGANARGVDLEQAALSAGKRSVNYANMVHFLDIPDAERVYAIASEYVMKH